MWNFTFRVRNQQCDKNGLCPIELSVNVGGKRSIIQLPMKVYPDEFKRLRASKRANYLNTYCEQERVKLFGIVTKLQSLGKEVTTSAIKSIYKNGFKTSSYRISDLREDYTKILKKRVGVDLSTNVYNKYMRVMHYVEEFLKNKECSEIVQNDMKSLATDMKTRLQNSTFANQWVNVKTFITFGIHNNKVNGDNLFATIKVTKKPKPVEYLTTEEIERIRTTQYSCERLRRVADFALLEMNLGLAYCDMVDIKREDIQQHGTTLYIKKKRMKTNVEFISIVNEEALEILERYDYDISITNQCYNKYLKQVGEQAKIEKALHSHIFRHTFAHQQLNEKHLNISTVSKMLGHTNLKQTQHYCQKHTSTILEEFVQANIA